MQRVLVALDGSDHGEKALELASDIAAKYGAELVLMHVISERPLSEAEQHMAEVEFLDEIVGGMDFGGMTEARDDPRVVAQRLLQQYGGVARRFREAMGKRLLNQARSVARDKGIRAVQTLLEDGDPANAILRLAKGLHVDVIFMGSRGLGDAKGLLLGSVSHKVTHLAECTCVSVK
jgi:nucleotide-binding universal stress UspA family protein